MSDRPLISMVLIARDEATNIKPCFDSFWPHVDQVVLVDTGSTDDTILKAQRYAKRHGAGKLKIASFDWCDDFSAARSFADQQADGDWLAWCDLDDTIHGMQQLRERVQQAPDSVDGFFCRYEYAKDENGVLLSELWRERVVRQGRGEWMGPIHECKIIPGGRLIQVDDPGIYWQHRRPLLDEYSDRNLRILEAWNQREPGTHRVLSYLGLELTGLKRPDDATRYLREYLALPVEAPDNYAQAARMLCGLLCNKEKLEEAQRIALDALAVAPGWTDTYITLAEIAHGQGRYQDGLQWIEHAQRLGKPASHLILNPAQYEAHIPAVKATCLHGLGRLEEAIIAGRRALDAVPGYLGLDAHVRAWETEAARVNLARTFVNLAVALDAAGDSERALQVLECAPAAVGEDRQLMAVRGRLRRDLHEDIAPVPVDPDSDEGRFVKAQLEANGDTFVIDQDGTAPHLACRSGEGSRVAVSVNALTRVKHPHGVSRGYARHYITARCGTHGKPQRRVLRPVDVAEQLRSDARITEFAVTDSGTACAVCEPCSRRHTIAIFTGPAMMRWHPTDITHRGLGGSETSAWRLAVALAKLNNKVTLYGDFNDEGLVGDVMLRGWQAFDPTDRRDAILAFRNASMFNEPSLAHRNLLWLTDLAGAEGLTPRNMENLDRVVTVSEWHRGNVLERYVWLDPARVMASRNGIWPQFFTEGEDPQRERRVLYTSSPDRGLDIVLDLWPLVRERVPDAELVCTYPPYFDDLAGRSPRHAEFRDGLIKRLDALKENGVSRIDGGIDQRSLATLMRSSMVWLHPSYSTITGERFCETSCISAMEAQAAGLVQVCGAWGALPETAPHAWLLDGDPTSAQWQRQAADAVTVGLTDAQHRATVQQLCQTQALALDWTTPADQLDALITNR